QSQMLQMPTESSAETISAKKRKRNEQTAAVPAGFIIDTLPSESLARRLELPDQADLSVPSDDERDEADSDASSSDSSTKERKPGKKRYGKALAEEVWHDEDDDVDIESASSSNVHKLQRRQRQRRMEFLAAYGPTPHYLYVDRKLATVSKDKDEKDKDRDEENEDDDEARAVQVLANRRDGGDLPTRRLDYERLTDANKESPSHRRLTSVQFNPKARVLLTASTDQRFALFQVDPDRPVFDRLHSHHMPGFPVHCARFSPDGNHIVLASVHRSFRLFDITTERLVHVPRLLGVERNCKLSDFEISPDQKLIAFIGKYGEVYLVDFKTRNRVCTLRSASSSLQSLAFGVDGDCLLAGGSDGQVSVFSLTNRKLRGTFVDEGSTGLSSLAASSRYIACGSTCGIVNLYGWEVADLASATTGRPLETKPIRTATNLTTECSCLRFHPSQELLLMASRQEPQAVRLWHLGDGRVMQNFPPPTIRHYLAAVHSADFSPGGGFLCLGQHTGRAAMFRLSHYSGY
ncbi:hypothetical protein BOX15_Mlig019008g1, partial [Macrostomum lignano]